MGLSFQVYPERTLKSSKPHLVGVVRVHKLRCAGAVLSLVWKLKTQLNGRVLAVKNRKYFHPAPIHHSFLLRSSTARVASLGTLFRSPPPHTHTIRSSLNLMLKFPGKSHLQLVGIFHVLSETSTKISTWYKNNQLPSPQVLMGILYIPAHFSIFLYWSLFFFCSFFNMIYCYFNLNSI